MTSTLSWTVVAINTDPDSDKDDCRQITEIGYLAPSLKVAKVDVVAAKIQGDYTGYHIEKDGEQISLEVAKDESLYVRTADPDTPDDPLLTLPSIEKYRQQGRFAGI